MTNILNHFGKEKIPFLFLIDFDKEHFYAKPLAELDTDIFFSIDKFSNFNAIDSSHYHFYLKKKAINFEHYARAIHRIQEEMRAGNTYLLNFTCETPIEFSASLLDIFLASQAQFKLFFKNQFVTFSPERFIHINQSIIKTYPMKGTIDAAIFQAEEKILADEKEKAEHTMVVDLMRNDLSIVAKKVRVNRFRYVEKINAGDKQLLQVSSEISGILPENWQENLGNILIALLPAGSISGAPKRKTVEIIHAVENYKRGFFTGIFGYFDGQTLDSAVMIRFIEKNGENLVYKSGGGITIDSDVYSEYQEMLDKVYIPTL